jgi:hypothetical protein
LRDLIRARPQRPKVKELRFSFAAPVYTLRR